MLLAVLGRPSRRARAATLLAGAGIVLASGAAVGHIDTAANPLNYFIPGTPVRVALERVDAALAGSTSFEFLARTDEDGLKDPRILARLDTLATRLASLDGIPRVLSVLDLLRETRKGLTDGEQTGLPTPADHPHLAAQLFFFLEGDEDFPTLVQENYGLARLTARVQMSKANDVTRAGPRIDAWIAEAEAPIPGGPALRIESTGYVKLMADMERYLFDSQVKSLIVAFIVITLMMFLLLRSVKLGLLAMIPNGLPILFGLGFMALVDIPLDPGTIMIGSMALGLVVDDTVHFLVRLRRSLADAPMAPAIERTMAQTGRPIIVTSVVLALGFATLGFGSFTPNVAFGVVSAVVILVALLADLLLLPAVLLVGQEDA
ncbi:MAG: MMPL family transporter [bacterium]